MNINMASAKTAAKTVLKFLDAHKDTIAINSIVAAYIWLCRNLNFAVKPKAPVQPLSNPISQPVDAGNVSGQIRYDSNDPHCAAIAAIYRRNTDASSSTKIAAAKQIMDIVKAAPTSAHITFAIKVLEALSEGMSSSSTQTITSMIHELVTMEVSANDNGGAEEP